MKASIFTAIVLCLVFARAGAELPPDVYKADQARSPEALSIKVTRVEIEKKKESGGARSNIRAQAQVLGVKRSASKLKAGDTITISYSHFRHDQPIAGPSEPDVLEEGRMYPAFLAKNARTGDYTLAARGYSFRSAN
jgi:hypothetical protein